MDTAADTTDAYIEAPVLGALACRCFHMPNPSATPTGYCPTGLAGLGFMKRRSNEDLHGGIGSGLSASMLGKFTVRKSIWPAAKIRRKPVLGFRIAIMDEVSAALKEAPLVHG